ncbi:hypothetical protein PHMEG_00013815 [Phytophthora megakarya]|uniref:Uncharacterized protein n=1 Tax=Phytophthora megakarya TaxID=4795 RepID=A0A225W6E5_9STRA|nr:hypothetical protein PHMEG_00013815 [Phytophthora megakarya]
MCTSVALPGQSEGRFCVEADLQVTQSLSRSRMQLSKLTVVRTFPDRPTATLAMDEENRVDFDEALRAEDSWELPFDDDEFVVERVTDQAYGGRRSYLNYGALLAEFERDRASRGLFNVMRCMNWMLSTCRRSQCKWREEKCAR